MRIRRCLVRLGATVSLVLICKLFYVWRSHHVTEDGKNAPHARIVGRTEEDVPRIPSQTEGARAEDTTAVVETATKASAYANDSFLEGPLPAAFREVLEKYPIVPIDDVKIVLIVSYYRSGSSFFGELMSSTPRTFFHYEPLMLFTVSGGIRPGRQRHAFQLLNTLLRCRFAPLYTAWMESTPHYKHNHFLTDVCRGGNSCFSPVHLRALCSRAETQVFKFTRLRVTQVQSWIQQNPAITKSVRVVHLVRDPRAIYASRKRVGWCMEYKHCASPSALCDQMRADLDAFGELASQLPKGRAYQIRFEDLASDPTNETKRMFSSLGLDFASSVSKYIEIHTKATGKETNAPYSTLRNSKAVVARWKRMLPARLIREVQATCSDILQRLSYRPLDTI